MWSAVTFAQNNVVDEVIWVVGDEAILKSDVESMRRDPDWGRIPGNPYCVIPERLAVQKLFMHQAVIDSVEVTDQDVSRGVEERINELVLEVGSKEKLEEYMNMPFTQIREEFFDNMKMQATVERMQQELTKDIKVNPAEVRRYFKDLPEDSLPFIPTQVEVEIIMKYPEVKQEEIDRVKATLRGYGERVLKGESFAALARSFSKCNSWRQGGELGYTSKSMLDPAFANVAFSLTDPKKVSKVVESEAGFHIIQLIDKRGDKIKCRHILLKPQVSDEAVTACLSRLDSIRNDIVAGKFTFEDGASFISDDKDTRNNKGLMSNATEMSRTSKFRMQDLQPEIAIVVDTMQIGEVSAPFTLINNRGKQVCAIVKLKNRVDGHKAKITEDFQVMKAVVEDKRRQEKLHKWVVDKIKATYVRVNPRYRDCKFEYDGWIR